jgi:glycosyltransferase involved in cell wall biosynthesis
MDSDNGAPSRLTSMSTLRRCALSLGGIPDEYVGWIPPAIVAGWQAIRRHRIEHLLSSAPSSTGHLIGLALARLTGLPWTALFQDPWTYPSPLWWELKPTSAVSVHAETAMERAVVRRANVVVCFTDRHASWLRQSYPTLPADKFVTIPNGFDGEEMAAAADTGGTSIGHTVRTNELDQFVMTYAGSLYNRRSPLPLFRALASLIDSGRIPASRLRVDLIGRCDMADGVPTAELARRCGLEGCVNLTGPLDRLEAIRRMQQSDLLLLLAEDLTLQIPGKTYEYLNSGRPILAFTSTGAVAELLQRTGGAWIVDPGDAAGVTSALWDAYRHWSEGLEPPLPNRASVAGFDRRLLAGRFAAVFDGLQPESLMSGHESATRRPATGPRPLES